MSEDPECKLGTSVGFSESHERFAGEVAGPLRFWLDANRISERSASSHRLCAKPDPPGLRCSPSVSLKEFTSSTPQEEHSMSVPTQFLPNWFMCLEKDPNFYLSLYQYYVGTR